MSPAPPVAEVSLSCFAPCLYLGLSGEGERVEMVETEAEEKDAAERERLRDDLWSSMSSSERLRGLSWSDLWTALDFLQQVRWAQ